MTRTTRFVARAAPHRPRRPGVTLIELLVVIAIIGILLALSAAALQKTSENQSYKSSTDQVFKLQQALDLEYERVVAKCAQDAANNQIPFAVVTACDGNMSRAKAVWTAAQLRVQFPETFTEATQPLSIYDANGAVYTLPTPAAFTAVAGLTSGTNPAQEESGALLCIILGQRSVSGGGAMATAAEDLTQAMRKKVTFGTKELETYTDAWKNSVGFRRWEQRSEVQSAPYVDVNKDTKLDGNLPSGKYANRDPLDPQDAVYGWLLGLQTSNANDKRPPFLKSSLYFTAQNRVASVYSVGKDKTVDAATTGDDILGFRLRKQGNTGRSGP